MNILKDNAVIETIRKELIYGFRSLIYTAIISADIIITAIFSFELFYDKSYLPPMLPQMVIPYFFTSMLSISFFIFIIAPSISISEEVENGTWDIIKANTDKYHKIVFGKILWQIIFMIILVLISIAVMSLFYYLFVGFKTSMEIAVIGHLKGNPEIKRYFAKIIYYSPLELIIDIFTVVIVCIPIVLMGIFFSRVSRKKLNSIIYSLFFSFFIIILSTYVYGLNIKLNSVYMKIFYGLNPAYMIPLTVIPMKIYSLTLPDKTVKIGDIIYGVYSVNYIEVLMSYSSYLIIYILLTIIVISIIVILQWKKH